MSEAQVAQLADAIQVLRQWMTCNGDAHWERLRWAMALVIVEAQAARPAPPLDWQAIETAPKGQDVLVLAGGYHRGDEGRIMVARSRDGASWWSKPGCYSIPRPISWMPLPAPPDARGDSQDESPTDR